MGVTYVKEVMSPEELLAEYPLPEAHKKLKDQKDAEIAKKAMLKNGFELIRCFQIKNDERRVEYCFAYKGVSIDLFFYELEGNFTLGHFFTSIIGISKLNYSNK